MISIVRSFGAPVIEPPGKLARTASSAPTPARSVPRTTLTSWCTVAWLSTTISAGTWMLPSSQTRPRSLRTRSAIIRFSARKSADVRSDSLRRASSAGSAARALVPLIGLDSTLAIAVDAQEALGRGAQHGQLAEAQQRGVRGRVARPQAAVGGQRLPPWPGCAARSSGRPRSSRPRRSGAGRPRCWPGTRRARRAGRTGPSPGTAGAAAAAGRARPAARSAASSQSRDRLGVARLERDEVGAIREVVDDHEPVAEDERRVRLGRHVRRTGAALGLQLVAEVAREPTDEVERELGGVGGAAARARARSRSKTLSSRSVRTPPRSIVSRPAPRRSAATRPSRPSAPPR